MSYCLPLDQWYLFPFGGERDLNKEQIKLDCTWCWRGFNTLPLQKVAIWCWANNFLVYKITSLTQASKFPDIMNPSLSALPFLFVPNLSGAKVSHCILYTQLPYEHMASGSRDISNMAAEYLSPFPTPSIFSQGLHLIIFLIMLDIGTWN